VGPAATREMRITEVRGRPAGAPAAARRVQ
jgi:hypothetical protein